MRSILEWTLTGLYYFVGYVGLILIAGAALFAVLFLGLGLGFSHYTAKELVLKGLSVGFRYAGIWAGGTALVLTVKRLAEKSSKPQARVNEKDLEAV